MMIPIMDLRVNKWVAGVSGETAKNRLKTCISLAGAIDRLGDLAENRGVISDKWSILSFIGQAVFSGAARRSSQ